MAELKMVEKQYVPRNFLYAIAEAVSKDQESLSKMQIIDAKSTQNATKIEIALYNYWNGVLKEDTHHIQNAAKDKDTDQGKIDMQKWLNIYSTHNAMAQSAESQQEGDVQSCQGQTQSDATNLANIASQMQAVNSVLSAVTNFLGQIIS